MAQVWEQQADALFVGHSIEQIRIAEKQARQDIEKKKEDLRQMVGARYRDLIDAADNIGKMAASAAEVLSGVDRLQELCCFSPNVAVETAPASTNAGHVYRCAGLLKILMDAPEQIWSGLEAGRFFHAAHVYQRALAVRGALAHEDAPTQAFLKQFPVLAAQWAAIEHFREGIVEGSRTLQGSSSSPCALAGAVLAGLVMGGAGMAQALETFLERRRGAVCDLLDGRAPHVEEQLLAAVRMVTATLFDTYVLFGPDGIVGLALQALVVAPDRQGDKSGLDDTLPAAVRHFTPAVQSTPLSPDRLHTLCSNWLSTITSDTGGRCSRLLRLVPGLADIAALTRTLRAAIADQQTHTPSFSDWAQHLPQREQPPHHVIAWDAACRGTLGQPCPLWDTLFAASVQQRTQAITTGIFRAMTAAARAHLDASMECVRSGAFSLATGEPLLVDTDHEADPRAQLLPLPQVDAAGDLCAALSRQLTALMADAEQHLLPTRSADPADGSTFDIAELPEEHRRFLPRALEDCITAIGAAIDAAREALPAAADQRTADLTLLLARVCKRLTDTCPAIPRFLLPRAEKRRLGLKQKSEGAVLWEAMRGTLHAASMRCQVRWAAAAVEAWLADRRADLLHRDWLRAGVVVGSWTAAALPGDTGEGTTVLIPTTISPYILTALCALAAEINRAGVLLLSRDTLILVTRAITTGLAAILTDVKASFRTTATAEEAPSASQECLLQLLFDVQCVSDLLSGRFAQLEGPRDALAVLAGRLPPALLLLDFAARDDALAAVVRDLRELIDPFDLAARAAAMGQSRARAVQRHALLLGCFTHLRAAGAGPAPVAAMDMQGPLLAVAPTAPRFALLPVAARHAAAPVVAPTALAAAGGAADRTSIFATLREQGTQSAYHLHSTVPAQ